MTINQVSKSAPFWVQDNSVIRRILHRFIDCIEKPVALKMFVRSSTLPELYDFNSTDSPEQLWRLIKEQLEHEHQVIKIASKTKLSLTEQPYENARIEFDVGTESLVRNWLARPVAQPYAEQWADALLRYANYFLKPEALSAPIRYTTLSANDILGGFVRVTQELERLAVSSQRMSLRTLSARCFGGDSKFLDKRRSFLEHVFPAAAERITPRAIMMSVYIPEQVQAALFVENFDSFRSTVAAVSNSQFAQQIAVVYSAGYRGSASLIRSAGHSQFVTINHATEQHYEAFSRWWFSDNQQVPVYFWGDLDFEGMGILKALRAVFTNAVAFQAGYAATLSHHQQGICHTGDSAGKSQQLDPLKTGCDYADTILLPTLRQNRLFTDQEVVAQADVLIAINQEFAFLSS